jgi:hypothetical protein
MEFFLNLNILIAPFMPFFILVIAVLIAILHINGYL